ncbi:NAD(P)-dependent dehydrogenase, short-chain alcohol dehydrogenase family [Mariprofundus aestuarium]|uniref:NAD(P)-dependent dehydrogenase, short-chain alcohol dehydrogenase family n=1 Tax=Mariprofundus aestuarium TaxID=1921086 RepID=A0A2K8KX03_MARES|nr:SDR family NAD(P)-dependent oxidoreductase [Mariprofundus aestuarium]ATX79222.1 NAD(P)-dependent dehydrogenase, short-chain alcohol dehydrogenase family [Mariprofundus aestuarium]
MSGEFKDRIIMVTGASDGIGQQVAAALGEAGASVIALGRNEDALQQTQERIEELGGRCLCIPFNLNDFDNYGKLFLALKDQVPHLDGLVHCAGEIERCSPLQYVKPKDFRKMLDIHLTAPNLLTQIMFPLLKRAESASVIFTTCDMVDEDKANWHAYGMAKRALAYAASMWQMEHPEKPYRFNTLNPGRVRTKLFKRTYGGEHPEMVPTASSVTPAYLYLLSDDSKDVRGQTLHARDLLETKQ